MIAGIDGGGTQTTAAIADRSGTVLGVGASGPSNVSVDPDQAEISVRQAVERASKHAGGLRAELLVAGLAGVGRDAARHYAREMLTRSALAHESIVETDLVVAHIGAFAGRPGLLVLAGTGSGCLMRDGHGRTRQAGGRGPVFDDVGSALDLGRLGLRAAARAEDGIGAPTELLDELCADLGISGLRDLPTLSRRQIAALAQVVTRVGEQGDRIARDVVDQAAERLASLARSVLAEHPLPVCLVGGLATGSALYHDALVSAIGVDPVSPRLPPVGGACLAAIERVTGSIENEVVERLARGIRTG